MSYDLMVFAPEAAPKDRAAFMEWYDAQTEWSEGHSYDDPAVTTPALRAWFMELIEDYAPLNGPFAAARVPDDVALTADCSIGTSVIYVGFRWSSARQAYETVFRLASKHGVGFFDVSSSPSEVWLPDGRGGLAIALSIGSDP